MIWGFLKMGNLQATVVVSILTWPNKLDGLGVPP